MVPSNINYNIGKIECLELSAHVVSIVDFIEKHLVGFINLYQEKYSGISNEPVITQKIEMYLNPFLKEELSTFNLTKEYIVNDYPEIKSPQCDLAFYLDSNDKAIFCIEAKRLPTPGSGREKEYVYSPSGKSGGIERFKKEIHGKELSHSAILGYIQEKDFQYWFKHVNIWIDELIQDKLQQIEWNENDKLLKLNFETNVAKLISNNKRKDDSIILYHFWLNLIDNQLINNIRIIRCK
ncbi:MAG: hypothetical protein Q7J16_09240 [Candidatus Cloacimonadales bacterium]|nr:hypothetical protein [Candidatus Cloacimonadales bacterium]